MKTPYLVSLIVLLATGTYALAQLTPPLQTPTCSPTSAGCQIAPPINAGTYYQEKKSNVVVRLPVASSSILPFLDPTWNPVLQNYPAATPSHFGFDTNGYVRGQGVIANKTLKVGKDWVITTPNTPPVGELFIPYASEPQTSTVSERPLCVVKGTGLIKRCVSATTVAEPSVNVTASTTALGSAGGNVTYTWTSTNTDSCGFINGPSYISYVPGGTPSNTSGSVAMAYPANSSGAHRQYKFGVYCYKAVTGGANKTVIDDVALTVFGSTPPPPLPTVTVLTPIESHDLDNPNTPFTVQYEVANATSCAYSWNTRPASSTFTPVSQTTPTNGIYSLTLNLLPAGPSTHYGVNITCTNSTGSTTQWYRIYYGI